MDHSKSEIVKVTYTKIFQDFQEFMFSNNVLIAAAGFSIGAATKDLILKLLDGILPVLLALVQNNSFARHIYYLASKYISKTWLNTILVGIGSLTWTAFEYLTLIFLTFFVLEYIVNRQIIGLKSTVKQDAKMDFIKSKDAAKHDTIIPISGKDINKIYNKEIIDKQELKEVHSVETQKQTDKLHKATSTLDTFFQPLVV